MKITEAQISMLKTPGESVLYRRVDFSVFCNPVFSFVLALLRFAFASSTSFNSKLGPIHPELTSQHSQFY
jgi:hypothetical protein